MKKINVSTPNFPNSFAIVDDEDFERVITGRKWVAIKFKKSNTLYAMRVHKEGGKKSTQLLHRYILNANKGQQVDHADGNGLNCRKINIRICTCSENQYNRKPQKNKYSKYKGVCWHKMCNKWNAQIHINRKKIHLGLYFTEEEAARAYDDKASKLFGEFAYLNFPKLQNLIALSRAGVEI